MRDRSVGTQRGQSRDADRAFGIGLARALGGAVIFALPILMTQEMWTIGETMPRFRLALLVVAFLPLLVGLSHLSGFEATFEFRHDTVDAFVALAVGSVTAAAILAMLGVLDTDQTVASGVGMVALQALPASMGALLAQSMLGPDDAEGESMDERDTSYGGELFVMAAGALFLAFNIAPTHEIVHLAYRLSPWLVLTIVAVSIAAMHAFVYAMEFSGQHELAHGDTGWGVFLRYSIAGYALTLVISGYILWSFGRLDGLGIAEGVSAIAILALPASVGAAAARLIL